VEPELLSSQVAIVTGAGSGIGAGVALALADAGAAVVLDYRSDPEGAEEVLGEIRRRGGRGLTCRADVTNEVEVDRLVATAATHFGGLDILVASSGIQEDAPFAEMTLDQWRKVLDVNLTGQFLACRAAVRQFRRQSSRASRARGKILCMSSVHEAIPWAGHVNYAASKGGVMLLMKSLAQEVAPERIRVNAIAPGAIKTPINEDAWKTPEAEKKLLTLIPYGRVGEVDDVGRAAVWLASDLSDYVTGTTLFVDGGMTLYPGFAGGG